MNKRIRRKHAKQRAVVESMLARRGEWHIYEWIPAPRGMVKQCVDGICALFPLPRT